MSAYIDSIKKPPKTLTEAEQKLLLCTTGQRRDGFRDHVIFSLALGTGLREMEILSLNIGDMFDANGKPRHRVQLREYKRSNDDPGAQNVFLPDMARAKLEKFWGWKRRKNQDVAPSAPLFVSRKGNRLSRRQVRHAFAVWQERAGFERRLTFHSLRHSACSAVQRRFGDIRMTQVFARHKSVTSTEIYTCPTDEDMFRAVKTLPC